MQLLQELADTYANCLGAKLFFDFVSSTPFESRFAMESSAASSDAEPPRRHSKFEKYPPKAGNWRLVLNTKKENQVVVELLTHTVDENTGEYGLLGDCLRVPPLADHSVDEGTGIVTYGPDVATVT